MKTIKIFLASSAELLADREAFKGFLYERSKLWIEDRAMFLELVNWEDFIDALSKTRLQDEYNKAIEEADIFVMLFWTKVGKYTEEEFETAYRFFKGKGKPIIYTYFKDSPSAELVQESLQRFGQKLTGELGHFKTVYKNTEGLLLHFGIQLDKIYRLENPAPAGEKPVQKMSKADLNAMINKNQVNEVFEELNNFFNGNDMKLNILLDEFVYPPNNFNLVQFLMRLKIFINQNWP